MKTDARPWAARLGALVLLVAIAAAATAAVAMHPMPEPAMTRLDEPGPASRPAGDVADAAAPAPAAPAPDARLVDWCTRVAAGVNGLEQPACLAAGLLPGVGRSVRGTPLYALDLLPPGAPAFKVLLLGGIHGDEPAAVHLVFDWVARVRRAQATPAAATARVAWRVVPLLNPDGLLRAPSTRVNAHGVDLNRNFPTAGWAREAGPYWVHRTKRDPRRYPGASALSEPESTWLLRQVEAFQPDLIVSVHAPYGILDFDGPPPVPDSLGSLRLDPIGIYPGSLGNYGSLVKHIPVMTLELKDARAVPPAELAAMWSDLQRWIGQRMLRGRLEADAQPAQPDRARRSPERD